MSYILNIETATKNCSVALAKEGKTILCKEIAEEGYSHAERLHVFIEQILVETQLTFQDLSAIAVSQGPGSYTGLRIGISAAKGLCFALDIPLIAIDTLAVLASQAKVQEGVIIPMIDARRMEVYTAFFDGTSGEMIKETEAKILDENSFSELADKKVLFIGDGAKKFQDLLTAFGEGLPKAEFKFDIYPSAKGLIKKSVEKFNQKEFEDTAYFEPFYLKDFQGIKKADRIKKS